MIPEIFFSFIIIFLRIIYSTWRTDLEIVSGWSPRCVDVSLGDVYTTYWNDVYNFASQALPGSFSHYKGAMVD